MVTAAPQSAESGALSNLLWLRISLLLIAVSAVVLVLISYLNFSNYRKTYLEVNQTRYLVVAKDLRQSVLSGLDLGLAPAENVQLQTMLRELRRRESGIRYLGVQDDAGHVIGEGVLDPARSEGWRRRLRDTAADGAWYDADPTTLELGIPIINNFNIKVGAVVIGYDRVAIEQATGAMALQLAGDTLLALGLLATLSCTGVYLLTLRFAASVSGVSQALGAGLGGTGPTQIADSYLGPGVAEDISSFSTASRKLMGDIAALEAQAAQGEHP